MNDYLQAYFTQFAYFCLHKNQNFQQYRNSGKMKVILDEWFYLYPSPDAIIQRAGKGIGLNLVYGYHFEHLTSGLIL